MKYEKQIKEKKLKLEEQQLRLEEQQLRIEEQQLKKQLALKEMNDKTK